MRIINEKDHDAANLANEFLRNGKVISFATDTIYGIAVDASNDRAVERLYQIKKRDEKKPIAIFVPNIETAEKIFIFDELAKEIAKEFLPGALTLVLETREEAEKILSKKLNSNGDKFIGFRIVDRIFIKNLFEKFDGILAVSSANISGSTPAKNADEIEKFLPEIDLLIVGEVSGKIASTVAKIIDGKINIIRQGPVYL
jgi:L-threonylcarbamoyladenylate synthase